MSFGNGDAKLSFKTESKESQDSQRKESEDIRKYSETDRMSLGQIIEVDANRESSTFGGLRSSKLKASALEQPVDRLSQITENDTEY